MRFYLQHGLPVITIELAYEGRHLCLDNVLLDTGSAGTIFPTVPLASIGVTYAPNDIIHRIEGVGGAEFVFTRTLDCIMIGNMRVDSYEVEVGAMDYGFEITGIIGLDFLLRVGAVIDFERMELYA